MAGRDDRREWELPHLREAHQLPVSIQTSKANLVAPFYFLGLVLMADLFRESEVVCMLAERMTGLILLQTFGPSNFIHTQSLGSTQSLL